MKTGDYVLSRRFLSFLGNYRLTYATGAMVMRFVGDLGVALRFDAVDAKGNVLFRGQCLLQDAEQGHLYPRWTDIRVDAGGMGRRAATCKSAKGCCIAEVGAGESLQTDGDCATAWSLLRREAVVARVERRGRRWSIKLLDDTNADFVLTVAVAIVHQTLGDERSLD